jgi:hypothetical protein
MRKTDKYAKLIMEFVHETRCNTISDLTNEVGILILLIPKHSDIISKHTMDCHKIHASAD